MRSLTIRHLTTYRYRHPVAFGEHRMMLRPRDSHDQRVIEASLEISPRPSRLRHERDAFGNHVAIAQFAARAKELSFESVVCVEHSASDAIDLALDGTAGTFPVDYGTEAMPDLAPFIQRPHSDPGNEVGIWARQYLPPPDSPIGTLDLLGRLSSGIHRGFRYRRREARGIQDPVETLRLGQGSCRDFAVLMIDAARSLGLAARFASGYLAAPIGEPDESASGTAHGATHAWAQVYLPGAGWVDFDPTSGSSGRAGLVVVAVVCDPGDALPLHGTFAGSASDTLGMEVRVSVTAVPPA